MKASQFFVSTLKEAPADAEVVSHRLMLRAGFIKRLSAGIYTYMPMGLRVIRRIEAIVREEMNRAGAVELLMPVVQPAELWQESGRFQKYGPELMRVKDRHDRDFVIQPTSEEVITDIARQELRSYRALPKNFYHIQTKFRDERRPRFGVMRGREFTMKDAYSFDRDLDAARLSYDAMFAAYVRIFDRMGLVFRPVAADNGSIGGIRSHEFQVIAETGEDAIVYSSGSDYAANIELAEAGGALGAALYTWHDILGNARQAAPNDSQCGSLLGPAYLDKEVRSFLDNAGVTYEFFEDEADLCREVAELLSREEVVGWMQGRMEFGPRALGGRSILGDARSPRLQCVMNLKTKYRESFRPFAPAVLQDHAHEYFETPPAFESPYMLLVSKLKCELMKSPGGDSSASRKRLSDIDAIRSSIPAVTHVDGSARIQTVDRVRSPRFHKLLSAFQQRTGSSVLINTSFNVRGEPIVCTPKDAWNCFTATQMDALVIERCLIRKSAQKQLPVVNLDEYVGKFPLD